MPKSKVVQNIKILFTCTGRRVSLLGAFRDASHELRIKPTVIGTDVTNLSPALQLCDKKYIVHPVTHCDYLKQLLEIVEENKIDLLIPTVDLDLKLLARNKNEFSERGCTVLISAPQVVDICQDKRKTFRFLQKHGFGTPYTMGPKAMSTKNKLKLPVFLKPWDGHASKWTALVNNEREFLFYSKTVPKCIVQEFIAGEEYTCDAYIDFQMIPRCVVPRKRIEVRNGEVSKAQITKNLNIMDQVATLLKTLGAGPGVVTTQLILTADNTLKFIEINPRFGGGIPLAIKAGANFPKWILEEFTGHNSKIEFDGFIDKLTMLRYDAEVWLQE